MEQINIVPGLSVILNIQQSEYVNQAGDTAGAVVVVLQQNQMPFPEDDGIIVSPGHATAIAITQV
jgi:Amiloride-sensitive sodium channel